MCNTLKKIKPGETGDVSCCTQEVMNSYTISAPPNSFFIINNKKGKEQSETNGPAI